MKFSPPSGQDTFVDRERRMVGASVCATVTAAALLSLPAYSWSALGLSAIGGVAAAAGGLLFSANGSRVPPTLRHVLGAFLVFYGGCCIYGGIEGSSNPFKPLQEHQATSNPGMKLWSTATSAARAQALISAARAARQQTIVLWDDPQCRVCTPALELGALNPSINPDLAGYRLIRVWASDVYSAELREHFGVGSPAALTLIDRDGVVPEYGRIIDGIDSVKIMDMLVRHSLEVEAAQ